jgi:hypothetical protein
VVRWPAAASGRIDEQLQLDDFGDAAGGNAVRLVILRIDGPPPSVIRPAGCRLRLTGYQALSRMSRMEDSRWLRLERYGEGSPTTTESEAMQPLAVRIISM